MNRIDTYSNLHSHDFFSILDGHSSPKGILERCQELGIKAVATTNHGNEFSFYYYAKLQKNFPNVKTQCYYRLAEIINRNEIYINCNEEQERFITEELEMVRLAKEVDTTKIVLKSKDDIKKAIGRSPDYSDAIMLRVSFTLKSLKRLVF